MRFSTPRIRESSIEALIIFSALNDRSEMRGEHLFSEEIGKKTPEKKMFETWGNFAIQYDAIFNIS